MDTPERQTMDIHLQSGYRGPFFELPGERVLESSSVTIRIERSVRMPAAHSLWPFNHNNKKVVIGGLMSRVDPQPAQSQIRSADIVRVVATVGEDGRIENVKPIHGSANLLPNVLKAVQQWRYQPTLIDGKPVETQCDVLFQFHAVADRRAQR
jgi:Gram-negative bacterial TonB protein C-terminal